MMVERRKRKRPARADWNDARGIDGALALGAILSPTVMIGVEMGNLDLLIFALVGAAAVGQ
jgi:hypothetical protein